ncbi:MAG: excinuclease ABC subunit UvrA [Patescibacteria group bacterium]|nr:excinuclease ABC subunit UvrA [Patescibacteria group bacterium]
MAKKIDQSMIRVRGARVHNLKNINIDIPRDQLVVITGLSGSGKSSLAFDTIYAEGQRRYVESLSAYARQFIGLIDKPDVDSIEGLSPAISIDQKSTSHNPRSTVGTVTEIYDYLRLLFARVGTPHCPECGQIIRPYALDEIVSKIKKDYLGEELIILAPIIKDKKGEHKSIVAGVIRAGFSRLRLDGDILTLEEFEDKAIDKQKKHNLEIVIDRLVVGSDKDDLARLTESIEKAVDLADGLVMILEKNKKTKIFSKLLACPKCEITLPEIEPRNFSFNSPHGACPECSGLGLKLVIDPDLILNRKLTIAQGAIKPWVHNNMNSQMWRLKTLGAVAAHYGFDLNTPINNLTQKQLDIILYGSGDKEFTLDMDTAKFSGALTRNYEGVISNLERRYRETDSDYIRREIEDYMRELICPICLGQRLKPEILAVKIFNQSIADVVKLSIGDLKIFFEKFSVKNDLTAKQTKISAPILREINTRLKFLSDVGLDYLTLDRQSNSLSGGEAQRIRLATQIGSSLMGVLYILDEPSIGLHSKDNAKLIDSLKNLRDLGNTVIVVEHDDATMLASDYIIDVGPGAGEHGGKIIAQGTPAEIKKNPASLTGQYLSGAKKIDLPKKYRPGNGKSIKILGASEHNLKNIDVEIPLGKFVAITGVSGSGKSTLMTDILAKALAKHFYRAKDNPGKHQSIEGLSHIDKVIEIDQSPIGRTPRSNPATYTGAFTPIRDLFASLPEAKLKGYQSGRFSFNVVGGRCEACSGDGMIKIEMQFLPDVFVECDVCHGQRYNKETLEIHYKEKSIADVLAMTVEEAAAFFKNIPAISTKLVALSEVGLNYIKLGQSATTLSGGEAQRIKLATELSRRATGKTLYILDEPTTGLHFEDIKRLLSVLNKLVDKGNSILIIEHNLDVIKSVDWVIDLGPDGGAAGGEIMAIGTPHELAKAGKGYTAKFLKNVLEIK